MRFVIVGGGLSGTIACLQLLRSGLPNVHITLIERRPAQFNRGPAYSARISQQLLNVPVARMGLFPDVEDGFHQWAKNRSGNEVAKEAFLPRHLFGDFVHEQFSEAVVRHPGRVVVRSVEAIALERLPSGMHRVHVAEGEAVEADRVLLALGNAPSGHVPSMSGAALRHGSYVPSPWGAGALDGIGMQEHVLFVGSGLSMVDLLLSLMDRGHQGPVTVISRRGFLPCRHLPAVPWQLDGTVPDVHRTELVDLLRWLRNEARKAEAAGVAWTNVIDAVRPLVKSWWQALSLEKRSTFLRHLRPFWEVHRHRMPADVHDRMTALCSSGRVRMIAARIREVDVAGAGLRMTLDRRGKVPTALVVDRLINCTGPESDVRRLDQPLLTDLLERGMACRDELHLGLKCTAEGAVIDASGAVSESLFLLGPMCKAMLWECTAVPEIRDQVHRLVQRFSHGPAEGSLA